MSTVDSEAVGLTRDAEQVTVVIPTILRTELKDAITSARKQVGVTTQIIVVVDVGESDCSTQQLEMLDHADEVIFTGGGKRGGHARNLGILRADSNYIAFLDDDDTWKPEKLETQLRILNHTAHDRAVIGCRVAQTEAGHNFRSVVAPRKVLPPGTRVEDYLFRRRYPSLGRASFHTSTILLRTDLAVLVPWDEGLTRHQDWDWLLRLQDSGASFHQSEAALVEYQLNSASSISATPDWESSLNWARSRREEWHPSTYADFLAGQALRYAIQARSSSGVRAVLLEMIGTRRAPSLGPGALGLAGLVPRSLGARTLLSLTKKERTK